MASPTNQFTDAEENYLESSNASELRKQTGYSETVSEVGITESESISLGNLLDEVKRGSEEGANTSSLTATAAHGESGLVDSNHPTQQPTIDHWREITVICQHVDSTPVDGALVTARDLDGQYRATVPCRETQPGECHLFVPAAISTLKMTGSHPDLESLTISVDLTQSVGIHHLPFFKR